MNMHSRGVSVRGFTLAEILVVIGVVAVLALIVVSGVSNFASQQTFNGAVVDVRDAVNTARGQTLASSNDAHYGIHVSSNEVTRFVGPSYTAGDPENVVISLPNPVTVIANFSHGGPAATFTRLTGMSSATGTIVLSDGGNDRTATITLSTTGLVQ